MFSLCLRRRAVCRTASRLDGAALDVQKYKIWQCATRREDSEKISIAMARLNYKTSRRAAAAAPELCAMHALADLLSTDACSMLHAKHATCARPDMTDARAHLPMGRVRWQVHMHKCARAPPHVLALRRCARAHRRLKAFRSRGR
eukprot:6183471-Pleurochrysis_carterae.AAC.3